MTQQQQEQAYNAQALEELERHAELPVGEILRRARTHYGLSLPEVEGMLRIRSSQLAALEQGQPELLPGRVYAIGFIRTYAEFLGLDGNRMVQLFKMQSLENAAKQAFHFPAPASDSKTPGLLVLIFSVLALGFVVGGYWYLNQKPTAIEPEIIPTVAAVATLKPVSLTDRLPLEDAIGETLRMMSGKFSLSDLQPPSNRIIIKAVSTVWLEIRDDKGKTLISSILSAGDTYIVPDQPGLILDTGNAGALDVFVNGQLIPRLGEEGDIRRAVPLDPDFLEKPAVKKSSRKKQS